MRHRIGEDSHLLKSQLSPYRRRTADMEIGFTGSSLPESLPKLNNLLLHPGNIREIADLRVIAEE